MHDYVIYPFFSTDPYLLLLLIVTAGAVTFHILAYVTRPQWLATQEPPLGRYPVHLYRSSQQYGTDTFAKIWSGNDSVTSASAPVTVSVPQQYGNYPLIVYLPAPTELAAVTHERYRPWVEAGYAVVVVSQACYAAFSKGEAAANADDKRVLGIRELLKHLAMQDAPPFDRIDFKTPVFVGCGSVVGTARALANAYNNGIGAAAQKGAPQTLIIKAPHRGNFAEVRDDAGATGHDMLIFAPANGGKEGTLCYSSYPHAGTNVHRASAGPEIAHTTVTQHLSLGFLDAVVKNDPTAVEWLERDAGRWLEPVGELRRA